MNSPTLTLPPHLCAECDLRKPVPGATICRVCAERKILEAQERLPTDGCDHEC